MPELTTRTFEVVYEGPSITAADSISRFTKTVHAAYFQQGLGIGEDGDRFVAFKGADHKPVFTVRASSVVTIEEVRDTQVSTPVTPEMQARVLAGSGAVTPPSGTTTFTVGGPPVAGDGLREAIRQVNVRNGFA